MSTMAKKMQSTSPPSPRLDNSALAATNSGTSSDTRASMVGASVVSTTANAMRTIEPSGPPSLN
eukprot:scaffold10176_cov39-Isochrysis_galbana.AAC.1